jgi:hypothetical protein
LCTNFFGNVRIGGARPYHARDPDGMAALVTRTSRRGLHQSAVTAIANRIPRARQQPAECLSLNIGFTALAGQRTSEYRDGFHSTKLP